MASKPIVPYTMFIRDKDRQGLKIGDEFTVKGKIKDDAKRMEFNLRHRYGIAFQYQTRFDENAVVCNTWDKGKWNENEEKAEMKWTKGDNFEVTISSEDGQFSVLAGNKLLHTYSYRYTALEDIDVFEIRGNLTLESVTFKAG